MSLREEILKREANKAKEQNELQKMSLASRDAEISRCSEDFCEIIKTRMYNSRIYDIYKPFLIKAKSTGQKCVCAFFCVKIFKDNLSRYISVDSDNPYINLFVNSWDDAEQIVKKVNGYCRENDMLVYNLTHTRPAPKEGISIGTTNVLITNTPDDRIFIQKEPELRFYLVLYV